MEIYGKQLTLKTATNSRGKLWKNITCTAHALKTAMAAVLSAPSYKPSQFLAEGLGTRDTQTNKFRRWQHSRL